MARRLGTARLVAGVTIAVALLVAGGAYLVSRTEAVHGWLERGVSAVAGPEVRFESVQAILWPVPGALLENVSISTASEETLRAPSLRATIRLGPLLSGRFELASVELDKPDMQIELGSDALPKAESSLALLLANLAPPDKPHARLPDVEVSQGTVRITGQVLPDGETIVASAVDLDFSEPEPDDVRGSISAQKVAIGELEASPFRSDFELKNHQLSLRDMTFTAYRGSFAGKADLALGASSDFDADVQVTDASAAEVFRILAGSNVNVGFETLEAKARLSGQRTAEWRDTVTGSGSAVLRGGQAPSSSVLMAVWNAIIPKLGPLGPGTLLHPKPTHLEKLEMTYELSDARMRTEDLSLLTSDFTMGGAGTIGLDGRLDLEAEVRFTSAGLEKLLIMTSIPTSNADAPVLPPIPTRITGTLSHPQVSPQMRGVDLKPFQALFAGAATGAGKAFGAVEGSVKSGVGALEAFAGEAARKIR